MPRRYVCCATVSQQKFPLHKRQPDAPLPRRLTFTVHTRGGTTAAMRRVRDGREVPHPSHPILAQLPQRAPPPAALDSHHYTSCCSLIILHCVQTHTAAPPDGRPVAPQLHPAVRHRPSDVMRMGGWIDGQMLRACRDYLSRFSLFSPPLLSLFISYLSRAARRLSRCLQEPSAGCASSSPPTCSPARSPLALPPVWAGRSSGTRRET